MEEEACALNLLNQAARMKVTAQISLSKNSAVFPLILDRISH